VVACSLHRVQCVGRIVLGTVKSRVVVTFTHTMKTGNVANKLYIISFAEEATNVGADWSKPHNEYLH
jgi:hypothetical protein